MIVFGCPSNQLKTLYFWPPFSVFLRCSTKAKTKSEYIYNRISSEIKWVENVWKNNSTVALLIPVSLSTVFNYQWSIAVWNYLMENSKNKQFLSFELHTVLKNMMRFLPHLRRNWMWIIPLSHKSMLSALPVGESLRS